MKTYKLIIEKNKDGFWGRIDNLESVNSFGQSVEDLKFNMRVVVDLYHETLEEQKPKFDFELVMDLQELFKANNSINFTTLAERIGMDASLLKQYANGIVFPGMEQAGKIENTITQIKIEELVDLIHTTFEGVRLGDGVSWRQADVLDDKGKMSAEKRARARDEHDDWSKVPFELIGDLRYQSSLAFLDARGLKFYLPICMLYVLAEANVSQSTIISSFIDILCSESRVEDLRKELNESQKLCVVKFLNLCPELEEGWLDTKTIPDALENIW